MSRPRLRPSSPRFEISQRESRQTSNPFSENVTSYFDITPTPDDVTENVSPNTPGEISPGTQPRPSQPSTVRRPMFRFHSDYGAVHAKLHSETTEENRGSHSSGGPRSSSRGSRGTPPVLASTIQSVLQSTRRSSWQSSQSSPPSSPSRGLHSSKEGSSSPQRRQKLGQVWGETSTRTSGAEKTTDRRFSSHSGSITDSGNVIVIRTEQTPLRPPQPKSAIVTRESKTGSIKIETEFTAPKAKEEPHKGQESEDTVRRQKTQSSEHHAPTSSHRGSINPKHIFSVPVALWRRVSLSIHPKTPVIEDVPHMSSVTSDTRMADHNTQLKRNYTGDALQRVTSILHEIRQAPSSSLRPPQVMRPLTWKSLTDKATTRPGKKGQKTTQGITSGLYSTPGAGSFGQNSDVQSYTSSQRNLRMGAAPTSTPEEQATYKIKRSPSAGTEEFLKVDISIRGGTSYLPSEARRIHTPPLPEEGVDGRWKGFFFDYNAPRNRGSLLGSEPVGIGFDSGGTGRNSVDSPDVDLRRLGPGCLRRIELERTKSKNKRILARDWYDVKLAEVDLEIEADQVAREGDRRLNSPDVLSKMRDRLFYDGKEVEPEMFDLTIPEHLPSSPLCPRHPRYWRVVKGKGGQFRGCWMHGVGVYED